MENYPQVQLQDSSDRPPSPCSSIGELDERLSRILVMDFSQEAPSEVTEDGLEAVQVAFKPGRRKKKKRTGLSTCNLPVFGSDVVSPRDNDNQYDESASNASWSGESESTNSQASTVTTPIVDDVQIVFTSATSNLYAGNKVDLIPLMDIFTTEPAKDVALELCYKDDRTCVAVDDNKESVNLATTDGDVATTETEVPGNETLVSRESHDESSLFESIYGKSDAGTAPPDVLCDAVCATTATVLDVKPAIKLRDNSAGSDRRNPAKRVSFEIDLVAKDLNMNYYGSTEESHSDSECAAGKDAARSRAEERARMIALERGVPEGEENPDMSSSITSLALPFKPSASSPLDKPECGGPRKRNSRNNTSLFRDLPRVKVCDAGEASRKFAEDMDSELKAGKVSEEEVDVKVDNNTLLRLMLDVFVDEEQLYKVYHATVGHTEDSVQLVFVILTDKRAYFLEHGIQQRDFSLAMSMQYSEIDFILLGPNYQTTTVVCKRRRKRYTFCTGNEYVTKSIISSLELATRRWCPGSPLPCIFTDAVMQTIGLKKWVAKETGVEHNTVCVMHYALVHWEDPEAPRTPHCPAGPSKEGDFMFRNQFRDPVTNVVTKTTWAPAYFVLRAGVLYQFSAKGDGDLKAYTQLRSMDFRGCRRSHTRHRPHVFELLLGDGKVLQLAAANEYEVSDWLQAFLQTVSEKLNSEEAKPCTACCLVVTPDRLFVCQEDLELFAFTTLGVASVTDLIGLHLDPEEGRYCILEFESIEANVCAGDWILYFASEDELQKFTCVLEKCWLDLFKVPLPKFEVVDDLIWQKCRDRVHLLQSSWRLGFDMLREPYIVVKRCPSPK